MHKNVLFLSHHQSYLDIMKIVILLILVLPHAHNHMQN